MDITYFCMDRHGARDALDILLSKGVNVCACVFEETSPTELSRQCCRNGIRAYNYAQLETAIRDGEVQRPDYAVAYLYHKIIKKDVIDFFDGKIINFHPAPVQVHRGCSACTYCLMNGFREWASTAHFLTEGVDEGDIIRQCRYPVPDDSELTAIEFERIVQAKTLELFRDVIDMLLRGDDLPRIRQDPMDGTYYSRKDLMADKDIAPGMTSEEIDRKIMSLWFPPYHGASVVIDGIRYSLVNQGLLKKLAQMYLRLGS